MNPWELLTAELDAWADNNQIATLWWRDDDAVAVGPKLDRLISTTENTGLLLAVIPANVEAELTSAVGDASHVKVAQHGYAHINHAKGVSSGGGAWELGLHRGEQILLNELEHGRQCLEEVCGDDFIPVIVPPWNRIDPRLFAALAARGFCGVSCFNPREKRILSDGFIIVNCHSDPIRWKAGGTFQGEGKTINQVVNHLQARRTGEVDASEPTGFLTHHKDLDEAGWVFSQQLEQHISQHPAAAWCEDVAALFGAHA